MQSTKLKAQTSSMRNSGIELLKLFAIIIIVIFHVVQTLSVDIPDIPYNDYVIDLYSATTNPQHFILILILYLGDFGNTIFFVCSAWFLLQSSKYNKRKWFFMLFEVWFISVAILAVTLIMRHGAISGKIIIKSFFPTIFSGNWYITCYLLFYPIHPLLNTIIRNMNKKQLFRVSAALFVIYFLIGFLDSSLFFPSRLIHWVSIYFIIAYIQLYMKDFTDSMKSNIALLIIGVVGYFGMAFMINISGLHISSLRYMVLYWAEDNNPFLLAIVIGLFNLMRKLTFKNRFINYLSSLSLLIYIIHENRILRTYYRPAMWNYIYRNFGYSHILLWVLVMFFLVFMFSLGTSLIYDKTIRPLIRRAGDTVYTAVRKIYLKTEKTLLKLQ